MTLILATVLLSLFAFVQALSFSAHNLKGYTPNKSMTAMGLFTLVAAGMMTLGRILGLLFAESLPEFASKAGGALLIVLAAKVILRGWNTKPLQRVYDLSRTSTTIGLAVAVNIDLLLLSIATGIIVEPSWITALTIPLSVAITGLITGLLCSKKAPITLPNLLDVLMGVLLIMAGIYQWLV